MEAEEKGGYKCRMYLIGLDDKYAFFTIQIVLCVFVHNLPMFSTQLATLLAYKVSRNVVATLDRRNRIQDKRLHG